MWNRKSPLPILLLLLGLVSWVDAANPTHNRWDHLKDLVIRADLAEESAEKRALAKQALQQADDCLKVEPQNAGCYYYRGQAKGILAKGKLIGYPSRVRSMLRDWEKAREIDPTIDFGGPDRMFAEIFIELPSYFGPKDLRKNLKKALQHLDRAIQFSNYPTNHLDRATALIEENRLSEAEKALFSAKTYLLQWEDHPYASSWRSTLQELEKKLR